MNKNFLYNNDSLKIRRRELRRNQTEAETVLWSRLSNRGLASTKFVRQYSAGPYIIDFYCRGLRLAIELDGSQHLKEDTKNYDKDRDEYLKNLNIKTIRFWNDEVLKDVEGVLGKIIVEIERRAPSPS